jgi:hypothetical protein
MAISFQRRTKMTTNLAGKTRLIVAALTWAALTLAQAPAVSAADAVTDENVAERVASAQTAADHEALAAYFRAQAAAAGEKVKLHQNMLSSSAKKVAGKSWVSWEMHCQSLIRSYKNAQKEAEQLAADHERLAKEAAR